MVAEAVSSMAAVASYQKEYVGIPSSSSHVADNHDLLDWHDGTTSRIRRPSSRLFTLTTFLLIVVTMLFFIMTISFFVGSDSDNNVIMEMAGAINSGFSENAIQTRIQNSNDYELHRKTKIFEALYNLQDSIDGTVYLPSENDNIHNDDNFACAAHVWSERSVADHRAPWAVIEVQHEADVQITVPVLAELKRRYNFPFRIRSGGHNKAGFSTVPEGAVISLVRLNQITIHPPPFVDRQSSRQSSSRIPPPDAIATMGPAVLVEQFVDQVLRRHGLAGVIGFCGTVAEGGFILGGGIGMQSRLYGLGLDNVVGMRIVLADGRVVQVSNNAIVDDTSNENDNQHDTQLRDTPDLIADLFWALRGAGGGSFGVVTELEYQLHKANDRVIAYQLTLQPHDMATFLFRLGQEESKLPGNLMVMHDLVDTANILWSGRDEGALEGSTEYLDNLLNRLVPKDAERTLNQTDFLWTEMWGSQPAKFFAAPTWAASCWYGYLYPQNNTQDIWSDILASISEGATDSTPFLLPDIELWGGAIHTAAAWNETAFPHRAAVYNVGVLLTVPADTPNAELVFQENVRKVNAWWPNVAQYLTGSYVNYPMTSIVEQNYPRMYWGDNLERLVSIKSRVDPDDVFSFPLSVPTTIQ